MAKTGYITSSGIQQVFTNGPYSGSLVTSSYASGSTLFGPTIDFNQYFISGALDYLFPCLGLTYYRYYEDLINCPLNNCSPPVLFGARPLSCEFYDKEYIVAYNSSSVSALYTVVEYSTNQTFSTNTGSLTYDNSISPQLAIDVSTLPLQPTAFTTVYFRAYNSCSSGTTSSYSDIVSATCKVGTDDEDPILLQPFEINIVNNSSYILYYRRNATDTLYALAANSDTSFEFTGNLYSLDFSFANNYFFQDLAGKTYMYVEVISDGINTGDVSVLLNDKLDSENSNTTTSEFPIEYRFQVDTNQNESDLTVKIDKSTYPYGGLLQFIISPISNSFE